MHSSFRFLLYLFLLLQCQWGFTQALSTAPSEILTTMDATSIKQIYRDEFQINSNKLLIKENECSNTTLILDSAFFKTKFSLVNKNIIVDSSTKLIAQSVLLDMHGNPRDQNLLVYNDNGLLLDEFEWALTEDSFQNLYLLGHMDRSTLNVTYELQRKNKPALRWCATLKLRVVYKKHYSRLYPNQTVEGEFFKKIKETQKLYNLFFPIRFGETGTLKKGTKVGMEPFFINGFEIYQPILLNEDIAVWKLHNTPAPATSAKPAANPKPAAK